MYAPAFQDNDGGLRPAGSGGSDGVVPAVRQIRQAVAVVRTASGAPEARLLEASASLSGILGEGEALIALLPPLYPEWLGDRTFAPAHGVRFPYVVGEMARGIASTRMVVAAAKSGLMTFFGSAGLPPREIAEAIGQIQSELGPQRRGWGANLIHSPQDPSAELAVVDLLLANGVATMSASAFMRMSPAIVHFAAKGLVRGDAGRVHRRNAVFAKVSRAEVARQFLAPAPENILRDLVAAGRISPEEAELARRVPVAEDLTVEADSGGHTDNRPLTVLVPLIAALRDEMVAQHRFATRPRIGAGGGIGTPAAAAAAFACGAAYIVTGSINQCTVESGLSEDGRALLAQAGPVDVAMAPAADMFELGVKVQVLKRGTLFAVRGQRLFELYRQYESLEAIPAPIVAKLEAEVLGRTVAEIWADTEAFFATAAPHEIERARHDPKHRMALVFRWYLFMGAQWAREGETKRRADYQIWCGPAMGALNAWVRGSFLEDHRGRGVVQIALNLLEGAAVLSRLRALELAGVSLPPECRDVRPRPLA